jgi:hypothetical protein
VRHAKALARGGLDEACRERLARRERDRVHQDVEGAPVRDFSVRLKPRDMSSSDATSIGNVISSPSCFASGTTRSAMRSIYENANSAPCARMACAMPQAIERSVASPTISARLPDSKNPC